MARAEAPYSDPWAFWDLSLVRDVLCALLGEPLQLSTLRSRVAGGDVVRGALVADYLAAALYHGHAEPETNDANPRWRITGEGRSFLSTLAHDGAGAPLTARPIGAGLTLS